MKECRVWKFGEDVDTDQMIASQYLILPSIEEMKGHVFESIDESFASSVQPGDILIAGNNFGCGSSREQAPSALKALGIAAVIAPGFARIFYRNAINIGLPVILCDSIQNDVQQGDVVTVDLDAGLIGLNHKEYICTKLPAHMQRIIEMGGLIAFLNSEETII